MATRRQTLSKLKKLLLARDISLIRQGVELVTALADPSLVDELLDGVRYDAEAYKPGRWDRWQARGGLVPNKLFSGTGPAQPYLDQALLALVARSPAHQALRDEVVDLRVGVRDHKLKQPPRELLLEALPAFPNLRRMEILHRGALCTAPLAGCEALEHLEIWADQLDDLQGLGQCGALKWLILRGPLRSTRGVEGAPLEVMEIERQRGPLDTTGLDQTRLRRLDVRGGPVDLQGLAKSETLDSLSVDQPLGWEGWPSTHPVREVALRNGADVVLPSLHRLERLRLQGSTTCRVVSALQPRLVDLDLGQTQLGSPAAEVFPVLEQVIWRWCCGPEALQGHPSLLRLALEQVVSDDLSAISTLPKLQLLRLARLDRVKRIPRLPPGCAPATLNWREGRLEPAQQLRVQGADLEDAGELGGLEGLVTLDLRGCTRLRAIEGLERSATLRVLDVRGCAQLSDLGVLEGAPDLRAIFLRDTGTRSEDLPPMVAALATDAREPDLQRALERPRPVPKVAKKRKARKKKIPVNEVHRDLWERQVPLLVTSSKDQADAAIDALVAAATPEVFDALLAKTIGPLDLGGPLRRVSGDSLKRHVFQRLVGQGPRASVRVQALLEKWGGAEHWHCGNWREPFPADPRGLAAFGVRSTRLNCRNGIDPDHLRELAALIEVDVQDWPHPTATGFEHLQAVERLRLSGRNLEDVDALAVLARLKRLELHWVGASVASLSELALQTLLLASPATLEASELPRRLEGLRVGALAHPEDLPQGLIALDIADSTGVALPRLRWMRAAQVGPMNCPALTQLDVLFRQRGGDLAHVPHTVRSLAVYAYGGDFTELSVPELDLLIPGELTNAQAQGLARLSRLGKLVLRNASKLDLRQLHQVPVEVIRFDASRRLDLGALEGHPTLRRIEAGRYSLDKLIRSPLPVQPADYERFPDGLA